MEPVWTQDQSVDNAFQTHKVVDTYNGFVQRTARTWQIIALASLAAFFVSLGIIIYAVNLPKTVPVIVTVNDEGKANYVGPIDKESYGRTEIPEITKHYQIKKLITSMYTWITDRAAQKLFINDAAAIVQEGAVGELDVFFRSDNPYNHVGRETSSAEVNSIVSITENTYLVDFTRTVKTVNGYTLRTDKKRASVVIGYYSASERNPLGVYVTHFEITDISSTLAEEGTI